MKTTILTLIAAVALCSCSTTGNLGADAQGFWNSPATQAELQTIQTDAFNFINAFITSHLGAKRSLANTDLLSACIADLKSKHPNAPDAVLKSAAQKALNSH